MEITISLSRMTRREVGWQWARPYMKNDEETKKKAQGQFLVTWTLSHSKENLQTLTTPGFDKFPCSNLSRYQYSVLSTRYSVLKSCPTVSNAYACLGLNEIRKHLLTQDNDLSRAQDVPEWMELTTSSLSLTSTLS